jgi:hypothetical protein
VKPPAAGVLPTVHEQLEVDDVVTTLPTDVADAVMSSLNFVVGVPIFVANAISGGLTAAVDSGVATSATAGGNTNTSSSLVGIQLPAIAASSNLSSGTGNISGVIPSLNATDTYRFLIGDGQCKSGGNGCPVILTMVHDVDPTSSLSGAAQSSLAISCSQADGTATPVVASAAGSHTAAGVCSSLWLVNDPNDTQGVSSGALDLTTLNSLIQIL